MIFGVCVVFPQWPAEKRKELIFHLLYKLYTYEKIHLTKKEPKKTLAYKMTTVKNWSNPIRFEIVC